MLGFVPQPNLQRILHLIIKLTLYYLSLIDWQQAIVQR